MGTVTRLAWWANLAGWMGDVDRANLFCLQSIFLHFHKRAKYSKLAGLCK
jgi:hypothetical protein